MLTFGERLLNTPVLSLQTGAELARTHAPVIDPANLRIIAFYISGSTLDFEPALLMTSDVREVADIGMIINSSDDFTSPDDLVTARNIINLQFTPIGLKVIDTDGRKLGKVSRYSVDLHDFTIRQLHVDPPLLKSLQHAEYLINRTQITAISDTTITVRTPKVPTQQTQAARQVFHNPFRQPQKPGVEHQKE